MARKLIADMEKSTEFSNCYVIAHMPNDTLRYFSYVQTTELKNNCTHGSDSSHFNIIPVVQYRMDPWSRGSFLKKCKILRKLSPTSQTHKQYLQASSQNVHSGENPILLPVSFVLILLILLQQHYMWPILSVLMEPWTHLNVFITKILQSHNCNKFNCSETTNDPSKLVRKLVSAPDYWLFISTTVMLATGWA